MKLNNPVIENRSARHEYFVEDTLECGIQLYGNEVKSIRAGKASIKEAWVKVDGEDLVLMQAYIAPWDTTNVYDTRKRGERRDIKLLAHKREIYQLGMKSQAAGYTLVPLKMYFNKQGRCKLLVGVCKGKKNYDKRASEKERAIKRDLQRGNY